MNTRHYQPQFDQHQPGVISGYVEFTPEQRATLESIVVEQRTDPERSNLFMENQSDITRLPQQPRREA